jgi:hypothetical protein
MKVRTEVEVVPMHEVLFIFKEGRKGLDVFLKCLREIIGFEEELVTDEYIHIRLKQPYIKAAFYSVMVDFKNKGQLNMHIFSLPVIFSAACRIVCVVPTYKERGQALRRPVSTRYYRQLQRLNYKE